jgi:hypothetical protein
VIAALRLRKGDALAVLSVEPTAEGTWLIRVARGPSTAQGTHSMGEVFGPYAPPHVAARFSEVEQRLRAEGYDDAYASELIARLATPGAARARAAISLGWRGQQAAIPSLLTAAESSKDEIGSVLEGLTRLVSSSGPHDPGLVELGRKYADRKLLSRRRSGVELLFALGDDDGIAKARSAALARMPTAIGASLGDVDRQSTQRSVAAPLMTQIAELPVERRGVVLDALYEMNEPLTVALCRAQLQVMSDPNSPARVELPHVLRYTKSVFKRAMLRGDAPTFGEVVHAFDVARRRTTGKTAKLKSGLDGVEREVRVFAPPTQRWMVRAALRHLRKLARYRPEQYPAHAAEVLVRYTEADLAAFSKSVVVHVLLRGASQRHTISRALEVRWKNVTLAKAPPAPREEPHPALWDRTPSAYVRCLSGLSAQVVAFGLQGVKRHPEVIEVIASRALAALVTSAHPEVVTLARTEIRRRFVPSEPDVPLMIALLDGGGVSTALGLELARRSPAAWFIDPKTALRLLVRHDAGARAGIASILTDALRFEYQSMKAALAAAFLEHVRSVIDPRIVSAVSAEDPEIARLHALLEVLSEALSKQLEALIDGGEALAWTALDGVEGPDVPPYRLLGAVRLTLRPDAAASLPEPRVIRLASDPWIRVRHAAHEMISHRAPSLSLLLQLTESPHLDTRALACARIEQMEPETLGLEGLTALTDATFSDVQAYGRTLLLAHPDAFDAGELLFRLAESPHAAMRAFALELTEQHLRRGLVPLMRIEPFARAVLLDVHPDRAVKRRLLELLITRGLESEDQAALVATLLSSLVRTHVRSDFDRVLSGLARLSAAYPSIPSALVSEASA